MGWKYAKERKHEEWIRIMAVAIIALGSVGKPLLTFATPWRCFRHVGNFPFGGHGVVSKLLVLMISLGFTLPNTVHLVNFGNITLQLGNPYQPVPKKDTGFCTLLIWVCLKMGCNYLGEMMINQE